MVFGIRENNLLIVVLMEMEKKPVKLIQIGKLTLVMENGPVLQWYKNVNIGMEVIGSHLKCMSVMNIFMIWNQCGLMLFRIPMWMLSV